MTKDRLVLLSQHCGDCPIRHRAVCARCDADELRELEAVKYYQKFHAGQSVINAGERMEFVGSVVSGVATLTQTLEDGRTQMVGLLLPSDFVGRPNRAHAAYDVVATTDLMMCCFRKAPFEKLLETTPHITQRLLEMTLDELDAAREWMLVLGRKTAREKIASLLASIANRSNADAGAGCISRQVFDLPITREAMADYLGLTLETVSRQMSALRREGVITLNGTRNVTVPDPTKLSAAAGNDAGIAV
ncbi:transcriptional regulator FnrL [Puniceibacterium sp. IMCC21224]|uniref:transcriptional regulator FnrL n=1 Tax=Puniceibacterium sp. IMCC21224 TaxID=1618204 RepID=UPI00064D7F9E|nr:Crp/Fnr family transcriptional regulator [Puniceibacterium sp. IMCC21224]KMK66764.1 cAMP-binding protein [Puniceibacterium sp. IMCC21224]